MTRNLVPTVLVVTALAASPTPSIAQSSCTTYSKDVVQRAITLTVKGVEDGRWSFRNYYELRILFENRLAQVYGSTKQTLFGMQEHTFFACFPELRNLSEAVKRADSNKALQKVEQETARETEQKTARAQNDRPAHVLLRSYFDYIVVKKCHAERQGYLAINISNQELERARMAVRAIEIKMLELDSTLDKNAVWAKANDSKLDWQTEEDKSQFMLMMYNEKLQVEIDERRRCQATLDYLERRHKKFVPGADSVRKDF